jgi:hypothetical protein
MVEPNGFELSVPVPKLADDSFQATFAASRRVQIGWGPGIRKIVKAGEKVHQ